VVLKQRGSEVMVDVEKGQMGWVSKRARVLVLV